MRLLALDRSLAGGSWYAATAPRTQTFAPLEADHRCDVAVVGGGLAGTSAALDLAARGRSVCLLEAQQIGWAASGRNGGQAIHGLACDMAEIERQLGADDARRVFSMSVEALDLLRERITTHAIDCDWRDGWLAVATSRRRAQGLLQYADTLQQRYGYPLERIGAADLPRWIASPRYHGALHDARSGHLHPLKLALGLARAAAAAGVRLHEHSPVLSLRPGGPGQPALLTTERGRVHADQVLLAGNVHLSGLAPAFEGRIMPAGTYIGCTEPLGAARAAALIPCGAAVADTDFVLDYFRLTADHRLLFGGLVSYSTRTPAGLNAVLLRRIVATFPQLYGVRLSHAWGGFVDISMNRAPDFARVAPGIYLLQGFSGHGLALTGLAGRLVAEAMTGDAARFDVFTRLRHRPFPGGRALRTPTLVLAMAWFRLRDMLGT